MADTKITALAAITTVDPAADVLPIVDISDTSMAASGTTKKITSNQILGAGGTATLASATITGDLTVDTSTLKVDSANDAVGIGTTSPTTYGAKLAVFGSGNGILAVGNATSYTTLQSNGQDFYLNMKGTGSTIFRLGSGDTEAVRLNATGLGIANGNVILSTSGKGIDFSATSEGSGTMTSELLNDYEEGTFTPVVQGGSTAGTATYSFQSGQYTKVGRLVTFTLRVVYTGGTGAGNLQIGGLPFTVGVSMSNFTIYIENISLNANSIPFARSASGISYIGIEQTTTGGGAVSSVTYDAAGDIQISGFYTV